MDTRPTLSQQQLLARNREVASTLEPLPTLTERLEHKPGVVIVTCMDPRCVPERYLNLEARHAIPALRNAGAKVDRAIQDILTLDGLIGLREIMLIHHTDCGVTYITNEELRKHLKSYYDGPQLTAEGYDFGADTNVEHALRVEFAKLKKSELLREELRANTKGYIFDIKTGELKLVVE